MLKIFAQIEDRPYPIWVQRGTTRVVMLVSRIELRQIGIGRPDDFGDPNHRRRIPVAVIRKPGPSLSYSA